jgi:hypothetical protein
MRAVWPHFVEAHSLFVEAREVVDSLQSSAQSGSAAASEQETAQENQALMEEFLNKISSFLDRNSRHRKSAKEFVEDPAAMFPRISAT